jgi:hypothetical protein
MLVVTESEIRIMEETWKHCSVQTDAMKVLQNIRMEDVSDISGTILIFVIRVGQESLIHFITGNDYYCD